MLRSISKVWGIYAVSPEEQRKAKRIKEGFSFLLASGGPYANNLHLAPDR